jgi:hypothetical protein
MRANEAVMCSASSPLVSWSPSSPQVSGASNSAPSGCPNG